jgi:hypothetical protein
MTAQNDKPSVLKYREGLVCLVPKDGRGGITSHEKTLCDCQVLEIFAELDRVVAERDELKKKQHKIAECELWEKEYRAAAVVRDQALAKLCDLTKANLLDLSESATLVMHQATKIKSLRELIAKADKIILDLNGAEHYGWRDAKKDAGVE